MSLPPVHISIKRRRQDDPVELLYLENNRHQNKRQFTDYCFQRLVGEVGAPTSSNVPTTGIHRDDQPAARERAASGIPTVRATSPGAEIRDEAERRAAQISLRNRYLPTKEAPKQASPALNEFKGHAHEGSPSQYTRPIRLPRQFRLSSWPRTSLSSHSPGVHKRRIARRNYLATFVEKPVAPKWGSKLLEDFDNDDSNRTMQAGRIEDPLANELAEGLSGPKPKQSLKAGQSMHDHPSTWDRDSDQLAEELAAFALELSQNEEQEQLRSNTPELHNVQIKDTNMKYDEDFIYDTYIRVPIDKEKSGEQAITDVGLLVIEDEDQELWQTFIESDDDSEWDEEDPDSNAEDNPANDYPDEEIDSDDEDAYGMYLHRQSTSDDEEYDLNEPWNTSK